jgi:transcriptional regulator with XRE-family HTH domain
METTKVFNVGANIRAIRERKGLSLRALAELSGLSINAISLIERGENSPTVSSLRLLSTALEVPITDFFQGEREDVVVYVKPESRLVSQAGGITMESLGIGLRNQQIEPFLVTVAPGHGNYDQPVTHEGEELVFVLDGRVEYQVDGQRFDLSTGTSLLFDSRQPHCFRNQESTPARLVMIFNATELGHVARRLHLEARLRDMAGEVE